MTNKTKDWWREEYGYFGRFYMKADIERSTHLLNEEDIKKRTKNEVDGVIRLLNSLPGEKIFDCPCGYGRHSLELASRGYEVTGLDLNSYHLDNAKQKDHDSKVNFLQGNMLDLNYKSDYHYVINMFASFGFFEQEEENYNVMQNFYNALLSQGKLLIHIDLNMASIKKDNIHLAEKQLVSGEILKIVDTYNPVTKRLEGIWSIGNEQKSYSVRIYSNIELENMCKEIGFRDINTYGDWYGTPYSETNNDIIVVAIK